MAESSSSPQPNQPYRPRQNQPAKKGNPLGCLLPLGVAGFFFAQQYLPSWSWVIVFGFIFVAIVASSSKNAKNKRPRTQYPPSQQSAQAGPQPGPPVQQAGPRIASTQFPPQAQPSYQPPPPPQQFQIQVPSQAPPQPVRQPKQQPRPQAQPQPAQPQQARPQRAPAPQAQPPMQPVPGTEHLSPALIGRVTELKLKGQTVEAIETLREATAMELYEASQIVRKLGQPAKAAAVGDPRDIDLDSDDFGDLDTFDTSDPYEKADDELERKWKQADEELDRAWQRELELDRQKWDDD